MIDTYTLHNGVRVVLEKVPHVRSVTIGIWILTGSRNEKEEVSGISHFLEHMMFKGTKERTAQEIAEAFDTIGGHVNAFTSKEYTCYYARVLDSYKRYALEILSDMFFHSTFLEEELEREKKVITEEIKMYEDTPDDHVHHLLSKALYGEHPLGRSILGTESHVADMSREALIQYMKEHYTPENIVISVAGNVEDEFLQDIEEFFLPLERKGQERKLLTPSYAFDRIVQQKDIEQAHYCLGFPGLAADSDLLVSLAIINSTLGSGMSSRLFQEVREKRGLAYSVYSYHHAYRDNGMLGIYAGTTNEQLPILQKAIDETVAKLYEDGLTDKELANRKEQLKGNVLLSLENTSSRMSRNGRNELLLRRHKSLDDIIYEIDQVDQAMIRKTLDRLFSGKRAEAMITPA